MYKENGRLEPADDKETAKNKGKLFACEACGYRGIYKNVEFGEKLYCPRCDISETLIELN